MFYYQYKSIHNGDPNLGPISIFGLKNTHSELERVWHIFTGDSNVRPRYRSNLNSKKLNIFLWVLPYATKKMDFGEKKIDDSSMRENKWGFWVQYLYAIMGMTQIRIQIWVQKWVLHHCDIHKSKSFIHYSDGLKFGFRQI